MLSSWKSPLPLKKISSLLKHLWQQKNLRYIVNIVIKLGAYLHSDVHFCPQYCGNAVCFQWHMFPFGYSEAWPLEVFGPQNWSFSRSPINFIEFLNPSLQEFWVVRWKPTNKMINFKIFNSSVVSLKMMIFFISWQLLVKKIFVGCRMSSFIYKLCSMKLDLQTLWECCLLSTKLSNQFDWNIHLWSDLSTTCWGCSHANPKDLRFLTTFIIPLNLLKRT